VTERRGLVLRPLPPCAPRSDSRAAREREARLYWDSLTLTQQAWALRKTGFYEMGADFAARSCPSSLGLYVCAVSRVAKVVMLLLAVTWLVLIVGMDRTDPFAGVASLVLTFLAAFVALLVFVLDRVIRDWRRPPPVE